MPETPEQRARQQIDAQLVTAGSPHEILQYQRHSFANSQGDECALELLPLPSPDAQAWNYHRWSDFFFHRAAAAVLAMRLRAAAVSAFARAFPPFNPPSRLKATAAGFFLVLACAMSKGKNDEMHG